MICPNPGYTAGLGKRSDVWKLAVGLKGSRVRQKELKLNPMQAVAAGRGTANDIAAKITNTPGGRSADFQVVVVFSKPGQLGKIAPPLVVIDAPDTHADSKDLTAVSKHLKDVAVGFVVCILDRKSKKFIAHARPLLLDAASLGLLKSLVAKAAEVDKAGDLKDWRLQ
jgi:hypothetical protein